MCRHNTKEGLNIQSLIIMMTTTSTHTHTHTEKAIIMNKWIGIQREMNKKLNTEKSFEKEMMLNLWNMCLRLLHLKCLWKINIFYSRRNEAKVD